MKYDPYKFSVSVGIFTPLAEPKRFIKDKDLLINCIRNQINKYHGSQNFKYTPGIVTEKKKTSERVFVQKD